MAAKKTPAKPRRERSAAQKAAAARNLKHGMANGEATTSSKGAARAERRVIVTHQVQPGDTLSSIASTFGSDADAIFAANRDVIGSAPRVEVGMPVQVETTAAIAKAVKDGATSTDADAGDQE